MTVFNATQARIDAQRQFQSAYPFEPSSNGLGISLPCGTSSTGMLLVGDGDMAVVSNPGIVEAYIICGSSPPTATVACLCILAQTQVAFTLPANTKYVAGITASGTTTLQISRGIGN